MTASGPELGREAEPRRFAFGRNWAAFLRGLDDERMARARASLRQMLSVETLDGSSFLDAGSGSGLFSLAAAQLGAGPIVSFDYDPDSVACTRELKRRFFPGRDDWTVGAGDCLDEAFVRSLGRFDVVYSWGVLHHTGSMWEALRIVAGAVAPGGLFYVALYNDQGWRTRIWRAIKRAYCAGPLRRAAIVALFFPLFAAAGLALDLARRRRPLARYREPGPRGMSTVRDWYDWLGGYPFEAARPEAVEESASGLGFDLLRATRATGWGCNEFVFRRRGAAAG